MRQFKINPRWRQCIISCVLLGQEGIFFIMVKIYNIRCMCDNGLWECKFVARGIHELHKHHGTAMTMKISWLLFTSIIENRLLCSKLCNSLPGFFLQKDMLVKHLKIMHCSMSNVNCLSPYWLISTFPLYSITWLQNYEGKKHCTFMASWTAIAWSAVIFHEPHQGTLVNIPPKQYCRFLWHEHCKMFLKT